jgi:hypothetical protein
VPHEYVSRVSRYFRGVRALVDVTGTRTRTSYEDRGGDEHGGSCTSTRTSYEHVRRRTGTRTRQGNGDVPPATRSDQNGSISQSQPSAVQSQSIIVSSYSHSMPTGSHADMFSGGVVGQSAGFQHDHISVSSAQSQTLLSP